MDEKKLLRLPRKLACTAFRLAVAGTVAGTLACGSASHPSDAMVTDGGKHDGCANTLYCGPASSDGAIPNCPGLICDLSDCPPGCEIFS